MVNPWLVTLAVAASLAGETPSTEADRASKAWMQRLIAESRAKAELGESDAYYEERRLGAADLPRFVGWPHPLCLPRRYRPLQSVVPAIPSPCHRIEEA
jgi:hypothetical protein